MKPLSVCGLDAFVVDSTQTLLRRAALFKARMERGEDFRLNGYRFSTWRASST